MGDNTFKYTLEDFTPQPIIVQHMDIDFDIYDAYTTVISVLKFKTLDKPLSSISLNAKDLDIHSVQNQNNLNWEYDKKADKLNINFSNPLPPNTESYVKTVSTCKPTSNILEGLYFDQTPRGAPPQQITQCQQWGFQRIVPSVDEMNAKCTYNTTITANNKYTNLLTNGDVTKGPETVTADRVKIWYDNTTTPMATYLFFLGVGTYTTFTRLFEYPDGSSFTLELLCPPGTDKKIAQNSLDMLFDGIMWIYLYTGKNTYQNKELADQVYALVYERERLKSQGGDLSNIRERLQDLDAKAIWGYKYTGTVYREIGMQNSNIGGMENVGNTTISTNRLLPHLDSPDGVLEYVQRVKTHEFYHNLNGSEVTGMTPFEIWLNEAVTVHMERAHHSFTFGDDYSRLQEVQSIISPDGGVLQLDSGALANPVIPPGFNSPDELITSVTYVKAPEFVRMVETILGKEQFVKGLAKYHEKFHHDNATTSDWLDAMQFYTDIDLYDFSSKWLYESGYPVVHAHRTYDDKTNTYEITLSQDGSWKFPFIVSLCDKTGAEIASQQVYVDEPDFTIIFENITQSPAFVSMNRGYSFYGKLIDESVREKELLIQVNKDSDIVARYMAFYQLWDMEKTRLLQDVTATPREDLIDMTMNLFQDDDLMDLAGTQFLTRFESVEDDRFTHDYENIFRIRKKISHAIATKYESVLKKIYSLANQVQSQPTFMKQLNADIKSRKKKNLALAFLANLDTPEIHAVIKRQYQLATVASERNLPALLYAESKAPDKKDFIEEFAQFCKPSLLRWETFLSIIGNSDASDAISQIKYVEKMPEFRIDQTNDTRSLYLGFAMNKRLSLLTDSGRSYLKELLCKLATVNEYVTMIMLRQFDHIDKLPNREDRVSCYQLLVHVEEYLRESKDDYPMSYNNLKRLLNSCPRSKNDWEN